jgi:hypothetical protein
MRLIDSKKLPERFQPTSSLAGTAYLLVPLSRLPVVLASARDMLRCYGKTGKPYVKVMSLMAPCSRTPEGTL